MVTRASGFHKNYLVNQLTPEVFDKIADYLSDKDVLNCSLVSRSWNQAVAWSKCAMKKLTIYYNKNKDKGNLDYLLKSNRPYTRLVFYIEYKTLDKYCPEFEGIQRNLRSILSNFASSLESINTTHDLHEIIFDIPKLKSLTIHGKGGFYQWSLYPKGIMSKTKYIENLCLKAITRDENSIKIIREALKSMEKLETLDVALSTFDIKDAFNYMQQCRKTLTCIQLGGFYHSGQEFILTQFPNLRVLHLTSCDVCPPLPPPNETIEELKVSAVFHSCENLLPSLKKLKILKMFNLSRPVLAFILTSTSIRKVKYLSRCEIYPEEMDLIRNLHVDFVQDRDL